MSEWQEYKLDDLIKTKNQGVNTTTEKVNYVNSGIKVIRAKNIRDYKIDFDDIVYIDEDTFERVRENVKPKKGDILFTNIGSQLGSAALITYDDRFIIAWNALRIVVDDTKIEANFLVYLLNSPSYKSLIRGLDSSSTMPFVSGKVLGALKFKVPNIEAQKGVAEILSSLDDKIELNNKINQELESLAQLLFKHWFVDFEFPNENGEPYKSSGGEMVDSELGEIPKGWHFGILGELVNVINGYAFKSKDFNSSLEEGIVKIKNINGITVDIVNTDFVSSNVTSKLNSKFKISSGDILIAMTGAEVGKIGVVAETKKNLWLNQRVGKLVPKYANSLSFIHTLYNTLNLTDIVRNEAMGSAQPNISSTGIEAIKILIPDKVLIENFANVFNEKYFLFVSSLAEIQVMSELRDTLLPKLISGELQINEN